MARLKKHLIFDCEIIGTTNPVFLVCVKCRETQEKWAFWHHKKKDFNRFIALYDDPQYTWVSFNGMRFDAPLIAAWLQGFDTHVIKSMATRIIEENLMPWDSYRLVGCEGLTFDHIDLYDTAPGAMISLKTYMGRMHYPTMIDLPFHHDKDLTPAECKVLETYCLNDLGGTEALFNTLADELEQRIDLGDAYDLDLRSKSRPQAAEAVIKKVAKLGKASGERPLKLTYQAPKIIKTRSKQLNNLIKKLEDTHFKIDALGSPVLPDFLINPIQLNEGVYKVGIGGLHSQHDSTVYYEADDEWEISDIDGESYYPTMILNCGYVPHLKGRGQAFMDTYRMLYNQRIAAKRNGIKKIAQMLKIALNGVYGKLGSSYCSFYAPDLMLAVCLTGQLNLLCLIYDLERLPDVRVVSANTDGIMVYYKRAQRENVFKTVAANSKRTGFKYEETRYSKAALRDVNNYIAIKVDGSVKSIGAYGEVDLEKNPNMQVCAEAAIEYLKNGTKPERFIAKQKKIEPFLAIRGVTGGGVQHLKYTQVDDWEKVEHKLWVSPSTGKKEKRVSRPAPFDIGIGGRPFGRVARWYMTTDTLPPITYVKSGNKVPMTEGAKLCMTIPDKSAIPADLDRNWYVEKSYEILRDVGLTDLP